MQHFKEKEVKQDVPSKKNYARVKESSLHRRESRLRADNRVFTLLLSAAKAAAVHHFQETALAQVVRAFFLRGKVCVDEATAFSQVQPQAVEHSSQPGVPAAACNESSMPARTMRAVAPVFVPTACRVLANK